jgi:hypothetical protein
LNVLCQNIGDEANELVLKIKNKWFEKKRERKRLVLKLNSIRDVTNQKKTRNISNKEENEKIADKKMSALLKTNALVLSQNIEKESGKIVRYLNRNPSNDVINDHQDVVDEELSRTMRKVPTCPQQKRP